MQTTRGTDTLSGRTEYGSGEPKLSLRVPIAISRGILNPHRESCTLSSVKGHEEVEQVGVRSSLEPVGSCACTRQPCQLRGHRWCAVGGRLGPALRLPVHQLRPGPHGTGSGGNEAKAPAAAFSRGGRWAVSQNSAQTRRRDGLELLSSSPTDGEKAHRGRISLATWEVGRVPHPSVGRALRAEGAGTQRDSLQGWAAERRMV